MTQMNVREVVESVLRRDLDPPSEDYGPYDYGLTIGRTLPPDMLGSLIVECLTFLPATLAASFIEGLLDVEGILKRNDLPELVDAIFGTFPSSREVSSSSTIVELLTKKFSVHPTELIKNLLDHLMDNHDHHRQDRLAYAIYFSMGMDANNRSLTRRTHGNLEVNALIETALASSMLSNYAREILLSCITRRLY